MLLMKDLRGKVPGGNLSGVDNEELGPGVDVGDEESQDDIDREEGVHHVVRDVQLPLRRRVEECDLERKHPRRVRHQHHHERLPTPA